MCKNYKIIIVVQSTKRASWNAHKLMPTQQKLVQIAQANQPGFTWAKVATTNDPKAEPQARQPKHEKSTTVQTKCVVCAVH